MISKFIEFSIINKTGIIKLNRQEALNALNYDMACDFLDVILNWKNNTKIERVILYGNGQSLCAGGDVKSLFLSSGKNNLKEKLLLEVPNHSTMCQCDYIPHITMGIRLVPMSEATH